jgi:hypothetical protein
MKGVAAPRIRLATDNCPPSTCSGVPPLSCLSPVRCHLSPIACHLSQKRVARVFLLASTANFRQNAFTCLDEASLAES